VNSDNISKARGGRQIAAAGTKDGRGKKKLPANFKLEDKRYPYHIYKQFSKEQKEQLAAWGKQKREKAEKRRFVKMMKEIRKVEESGSEAEAQDEEADQAGKQFGRSAHKKGKKE